MGYRKHGVPKILLNQHPVWNFLLFFSSFHSRLCSSLCLLSYYLLIFYQFIVNLDIIITTELNHVKAYILTGLKATKQEVFKSIAQKVSHRGPNNYWAVELPVLPRATDFLLISEQLFPHKSQVETFYRGYVIYASSVFSLHRFLYFDTTSPPI